MDCAKMIYDSVDIKSTDCEANDHPVKYLRLRIYDSVKYLRLRIYDSVKHLRFRIYDSVKYLRLRIYDSVKHIYDCVYTIVYDSVKHLRLRKLFSCIYNCVILQMKVIFPGKLTIFQQSFILAEIQVSSDGIPGNNCPEIELLVHKVKRFH